MAVVMVERAPVKFPGALGEPIQKPLMFPFGVAPGDNQRERNIAYKRRLLELRFEKLLLLLRHYEIPTSEHNQWLILAWHLACDFVPGMQVVDRLPKRARPREKWGLELAHQLCDVIDTIRAEHPGRSIAHAIKIAQKRHPNEWGKYKASTLETRYHEIKKGQLKVKPPKGLLNFP